MRVEALGQPTELSEATRSADGTLVQIYWWERDGMYCVIRCPESGSRLEQVGRFHDLDAAIALAMRIGRQDV